MIVVGTLWLALGLVGDATPAEPVREAMGKGNYPWYDARSDSVRPLMPAREWNWDWVPDWKFPWAERRVSGIGSVGEVIALSLAGAALTALIGVLIWLWMRNQPGVADEETVARSGRAARVEGLPEGLRPETSDPWTEAIRRRQRGDYAGAVVCLFAHQLLTLDRLRQLRLAPGRTGRQLVGTLDDAEFRSWVEPTLRMFEAVYYGHRSPSAESFEAVWSLALQFERRVAEGARA